MYAKANDHEDFADKVLLLLNDPEKCQSMGEFGRTRVTEKLSWDHERQGYWQHTSMCLDYEMFTTVQLTDRQSQP